jgi:hypothetical protein
MTAMPGPGRPPGALNKLTRDLKQAMLAGAEKFQITRKTPQHPDVLGSSITATSDIKQILAHVFVLILSGSCV